MKFWEKTKKETIKEAEARQEKMAKTVAGNARDALSKNKL